MNSVARAVHAPVMDPAGQAMDPQGDQALRAAFSGRLRSLLGERRAAAVRDIVDCGCATGALQAHVLLMCVCVCSKDGGQGPPVRGAGRAARHTWCFAFCCPGGLPWVRACLLKQEQSSVLGAALSQVHHALQTCLGLLNFSA